MSDDPSAATHQDFGHRYWRSTRSVPEPLGDLDTGGLDDATFRLLADSLPTLCWIANGDGYIVWYNRRWHEYCGTTPADMEGWGWQTVHDPVLLPTVMARWRDAIVAGEPFEMVFPLRGADDVFRPFLTRISPVRDATGAVKRWCGVNTEISDQVAAETALRAEQAALRTSEAQLEAIFANASVGLSEVAPDGRFLRVNGELCRILGRRQDELLSLGVADVTFPADIPASLKP